MLHSLGQDLPLPSCPALSHPVIPLLAQPCLIIALVLHSSCPVLPNPFSFSCTSYLSIHAIVLPIAALVLPSVGLIVPAVAYSCQVLPIIAPFLLSASQSCPAAQWCHNMPNLALVLPQSCPYFAIALPSLTFILPRIALTCPSFAQSCPFRSCPNLAQSCLICPHIALGLPQDVPSLPCSSCLNVAVPQSCPTFSFILGRHICPTQSC